MSFSQLRVKEQQYHSLNPYYNGKYSMSTTFVPFVDMPNLS